MAQLFPWRPFGELDRLRRDMDDLWSRFLGERSLGSRALEDWMPVLDVSETEGELHVRAELPGLEAKDIDLSVTGDLLTLKGEKKEERKTEDENFVSRESYAGAFQRTIRLPSEVKGDEVKASFKNGVLSVKMPKSQKSSTRKIEITSA